MTWETMTGDIIIQDGTFAFLFKASGTIYKGQAVYVKADNAVTACTADASECEAIGVAIDDASHGSQVGIAGPGNIVRCAGDADIAPGTLVYGDADGSFDATAGNATKVGGVVVKSDGTVISSSYYDTQIMVL